MIFFSNLVLISKFRSIGNCRLSEAGASTALLGPAPLQRARTEPPINMIPKSALKDKSKSNEKKKKWRLSFSKDVRWQFIIFLIFLKYDGNFQTERYHYTRCGKIVLEKYNILPFTITFVPCLVSWCYSVSYFSF